MFHVEHWVGYLHSVCEAVRSCAFPHSIIDRERSYCYRCVVVCVDHSV